MRLINPDIRFEVTNKCNYHCPICPREKQKRDQGVMSLELFKKTCGEGFEMGMKQASLVGYGEPLLDPGFFDKAEYAKSKGIFLYTITNASLLDRETARKFIEVRFDCIRISCYGIDRESYIKMHNRDRFDQVMDNVEYLLSLRKKLEKSGLKVVIYFLVTGGSAAVEESFKKLWLGKADDISIWRPHNWGDGRKYRPEVFPEKSCGRPMKGPLQVQWSGIMVPCCWCYDDQIVLGDANLNSLEEIVTGDAYENLRRAHGNMELRRYPFCEGCDQLQQRDDSLIFTTIKNSRVGRTNTNQFAL